MNWFTKLLKSKIHITIVTPPPEGVRYSTDPRVIVMEDSKFKRSAYSNLRFISERKTDSFGNEGHDVFWTEEYIGGKWSCIIDSISCTKETAMELHLQILQRKTVPEIKTKTILWEGLGVDEAKVWVELCK